MIARYLILVVVFVTIKMSLAELGLLKGSSSSPGSPPEDEAVIVPEPVNYRGGRQAGYGWGNNYYSGGGYQYQQPNYGYNNNYNYNRYPNYQYQQQQGWYNPGYSSSAYNYNSYPRYNNQYSSGYYNNQGFGSGGYPSTSYGVAPIRGGYA